jgi:hypothetical protein
VPRTNGPFSEPASLAFYLSGVVYATAWVLVRGHRSRLAAVLLPASVAMMFVSTSTTGYVVLGVGGGFLLLLALLGGSGEMSGRIFKYGVPLAVLALLGTLAAAAMDPQFAASMQEVLTETLNKGQGNSYDDRTSLDRDCLGILFPSAFLGAGWGSARSSSLVPGLLANLGVIGVLPLVWFGLKLAWQVRQARMLTADADRLMVIDAMSASLVGTLVAACVSAPTISTIDFFLALGVLVGCVARVRMEAGYRTVGWAVGQPA